VIYNNPPHSLYLHANELFCTPSPPSTTVCNDCFRAVNCASLHESVKVHSVDEFKQKIEFEAYKQFHGHKRTMNL
jgi:hypothetical protein